MPDALTQRFLHELSELRASGLLAAEIGLAAIVAGLALRPQSSPRTRFVAALSFSVCIAVWVVLAWQQRWVCDDAFISFRYARNWAEGKGLVWNPGERVEGYTNFLWTALIAGMLRLHADPVASVVGLGFASALVALALCWKLSRELSPGPGALLVAPSVVLLAGNHLFAQFTTSGLETMFAATLSLFALERAINDRLLSAGFAGVLATMAHPDHALAYAALFFALCLDPAARRGGVKGLITFVRPYVVPFFVLYVPYFVCKALYYGSFVPNTYYTKSAGSDYFSQGVTYLLISVASLGFLGTLPLAVASLFMLRNSLLVRYMALLGPTYLFYVAKIGGDFMLGRLLVLLLLPLAVLLDAGAQALFARGGRSRFGGLLGCAAAGSLLISLPIVRPFEKYNHVADEQTFYRLQDLRADAVVSQLTDMARSLQLALARVSGPDLPTMVTGCVGIVGYLTGLRIIDSYGLTDPHVARQPIAERGRPGHEKLISLAYALDSGGDFTDLTLWPARFNRYTEFHVGNRAYHLLAHRPRRVAAFRTGSNVLMPPTSAQLQFYHPGQGQLECDQWFFDTFYFRHHPHAEKLSFVQRMVDEGYLDPSLQEFENMSPGEHPSGYKLVRPSTSTRRSAKAFSVHRRRSLLGRRLENPWASRKSATPVAGFSTASLVCRATSPKATWHRPCSQSKVTSSSSMSRAVVIPSCRSRWRSTDKKWLEPAAATVSCSGAGFGP